MHRPLLILLVAAACGAAEHLTGWGVAIDLGNGVEMTLQYPLPRTAAGNVGVNERTVDGDHAHLVFADGATGDFAWANGTLTATYASLPADAKQASCQLAVPIDFVQGGTWAIGDGEAKPFPAAKPASPMLFQGGGDRITLHAPNGATVVVRVPPGYMQLQDNREWNAKEFSWWNLVELDRDHPAFSVALEVERGKAGGFLLDKYGQDVNAKIPRRVTSDDDLARDVVDEKAFYESLKPPTRDPYGGLPGSREKLGLRQTGFFHVQKVGERWFLVDPDGDAFFHLGVCGFGPMTYTYVKGRENLYEWLPPHDGEFASAWNQNAYWNPTSISFHVANQIRKYHEPFTQAAYDVRMIDRLRRLGFNSIGAFSGVPTEPGRAKKFPYALGVGVPEQIPGVGDTFDPFDEEQRAAFRDAATGWVSSMKDDPLLIGWFLGNEPIHEAVQRVVPTLTSGGAKAKLVEVLRERYHGDIAAFAKAWNVAASDFPSLVGKRLDVTTQQAADDAHAFAGVFFEAYFAFVEKTIRDADPNHLLIGCRWQPGTANDEQLVTIAGKHVDLISLNYYTYAIDDAFVGDLHRWSGGKPMFFSEFYWSSPSDSGLLGGALDVGSIEQRGLAYRHYVEHAAALGYVVGIEWFTLVDESRTGNHWSYYNGEAANTGLFDVTDRPYRPQVDHMAKTNFDIYEVELGKRAPFVWDDPRFTGKAGARRVAHIARATKAIPLDGTRDAWPGVPPELIPASRTVAGTNTEHVEASFRLAWDATNLYLLAEVVDPSPMKNAQRGNGLYVGDGVELFVGHDRLDDGGAPLFSDRQVLLGAGRGDGKEQAWFVNLAKQPGCGLRSFPSATGYVLEAAIPFASLGVAPKPGMKLRFDLAIDDSADGARRECQLMWNGGQRNSTERGGWGEAVLDE